MKKFSFATIFLLTFLLCVPMQSFAASPIEYNKPVSVEILRSGNNISIGLQGFYLLQNQQSNGQVFLQPGSTITVSRSNSNISVTTSGATYSSSTGFVLRELTPNQLVNSFSSTTRMRSAEAASSQEVGLFNRGEAALFHRSVVNASGETWFNVTNGSGVRGWVPASTTFAASRSAQLPLVSVNGKRYRGGLELKRVNDQVQVLNQLDIEDYLKSVVPNEMPASWHMEALKAQAISARSYALNTMNLTNTPATQVYGGYDTEAARSTEAIEATKGLVVLHQGRPIQTFFSSTSGGRTANVADVWNSNQNNFPYLVSVDDPFEVSPHSNWTQAYNSRTILNSFGFTGSNVYLYDIRLNKTGANGEVRGVTVETSQGSNTVNGNELQIRRLFPREGTYGFLQSNWFDMEATKSYTIQHRDSAVSQFAIYHLPVQLANGTTTVNGANVQIQLPNSVVTRSTDPETIVLNGKGWGHRVGMSQYGAKGFAEQGWTAEQILTHYYQGTTVGQAN